MNRDEWNRRYAASELLWSAEPNRFLREEAEALPSGRAVDLACGEGRNALWLAGRGWEVTAVDFSDVALARARELSAARGVDVNWVEADVREWEPPREAFDLVAVLYLQLPAPERTEVHARAARALRSGGTLLVVAHHRSNLTEGWGGPSSPAVLATETEVAADLDGLRIVRAERVRRPVATGEREDAVALDLLVRAERP